MTVTSKTTEFTGGVQVSYADDTMPGFSAVITRFTGSRTYAVVGHHPQVATPIHCYNGPHYHFSKRDADKMARLFVTRACESL